MPNKPTRAELDKSIHGLMKLLHDHVVYLADKGDEVPAIRYELMFRLATDILKLSEGEKTIDEILESWDLYSDKINQDKDV